MEHNELIEILNKKDNLWLKNKFIAHRGLHNEIYPENSLSAFKNAIDHSYAIELDVRKTLDDVLVVCHDDNLKRTTGDDINISKSNYEDIKNLKIFNSEENIATFKEVLSLVNGQTELLIEIKSTDYFNRKLEKLIYDELKNYNGVYAIESFNPKTVLWYKKNAPEIIRGQLSSFFTESPTLAHSIIKKMRYNKITKPHFISYHAENLPNEYVDEEKNNGLLIMTWTIKSQDQYDNIKPHVDNIIFENFEPKK